jgi:hypothetical protein
VLRRDGHGRAVDLWGLGAVALAMLAARTPAGAVGAGGVSEVHIHCAQHGVPPRGRAPQPVHQPGRRGGRRRAAARRRQAERGGQEGGEELALQLRGGRRPLVNDLARVFAHLGVDALAGLYPASDAHLAWFGIARAAQTKTEKTVAELSLDLSGGGVQITGSHNPPEFNGFQMLLGRDAMHGDGVQGLYRRMVSQEFVTGAGSLERLEIEESYLNHVASGITMGPRALKVLIDGGNGIGGPLALQLAARLGVEAVGRFIEPDGRFPNHHPDPTTVETVEIMAHDVKAYGCDFAVGLDGDADRVGVVDGNGEVQWGDRLLALFARGVLKEAPGATIVGEVKCSKTLYDDIAKHGGAIDEFVHPIVATALRNKKSS